jgi:hypothetical protein
MAVPEEGQWIRSNPQAQRPGQSLDDGPCKTLSSTFINHCGRCALASLTVITVSVVGPAQAQCAQRRIPRTTCLSAGF